MLRLWYETNGSMEEEVEEVDADEEEEPDICQLGEKRMKSCSVRYQSI